MTPVISAGNWANDRPPAGRMAMAPGEYRDRYQRVAAEAGSRTSGRLDGMLIWSSYMEREGNVLYLSGHRIAFPPWASDAQRNGAGYSALLWVPGDGLHLFAAFHTDQAVLAPTVTEAVETLDMAGALIAGIRQAYGPQGPKVLGIAGSDVMNLMTYRALRTAFPQTEWPVVDDVLLTARMRKSPYEQAALRWASQVADAGIRAAHAAGKPGVTERTVALAVHQACMAAGADHVVRIRLRTGDAVLVPGRWPLATDRVIGAGDLVYMDLLGWAQGYAFDVARTWSAGATDARREELLRKSSELLEHTVAALKPGVTGDMVVHRAIAPFVGTPWVDRYAPMGHGIGIECVENPWIMPGSTIPLAPGMVLSLEPEFVIPGLGKAQQEDMVLVTASGAEVLTQAPRLPG